MRRLIVDASNLGLNGASTRIRLTQPVNITRELRLNSGTLDLTNETGGFLVTNALTLLSTATSTASVNTNDQLSQGTGLVSGGPVSVQRFVDLNVNESAVSGYRHLSAPVAGATVAMLATSGFAPNVVGGSDYNTSATPGTTSSFPNVFFYDERKQTNVNDLPIFAKGWQAPTAPDEALAAARGYTVQMPGQQTITFSGAPRLAPVSVALTRQSPTAAAGWNLVGNPFAAGFNLVSLAGTANVDDAKYVFESTGPFTGAYRVFLPALPSSGNPIVALGQGFFTRVSTGATAATLTMNVTKTVVDDNTPFRRDAAETRPLVALTLRNAAGTLGDLTTVYADAQATTGFDPRFDAYKLANPSGLNLSQQSADARLAIQGLPALTAAPVVPLNVQVPAAGTYRLQVARLLNLPAGTTATLVDNVTGARLNLAELPAAGHSFTTTGAEVLNTRFVLHFGGNGPLASTSALLAGGLRLSPNPAHGRATVELPAVAGAARATLTLRDALGRTVRTHTAALPAAGLRHELDLSRLAPGVYLLQVQAGAAQTTRRLLVD